jgi:[ribosomal protein S18]-alanine N-acetyltransferase
MSNSQLQIRPAAASDFVSVVALERATQNAPHWPPAAYAAILETPPDSIPHRCLFVALNGQTLAGFAVGVIPPPNATEPTCVAELESVAVDTAHRRTGIGRALCSAVIDWCRSHGATEIILEVRASSAAAVALYAGLGFTQTGRRRRYYRNPGDDALVMRLPSPSEKN